jgi:ABC-type nitrate/sulfonate/bicarbonate transport system substrate-binding protein
MGFFKDEGLEAKFTGVIGPGQHIAAVVAGTNDIGGMHVNRTINGIVAGAKIRAVVAESETSKEYPHMEFVVLQNSPLKTPQDILGKKVGLVAYGGCNEYTPYEILKKFGVSEPKGKFTLVLVPPGKEEQTLRAGDVDVVGYHGHPDDVFSRGGVRVLFDDYDVWGTVGGATPIYFSEKFIKQKPDVVRRFVRAYARTLNWVNANRDKAKEVQGRRQKMDPAKITIMNYAKDGIIKEDSVAIWLKTLRAYGEIKKEIKPSDVFTNEFNELAKN